LESAREHQAAYASTATKRLPAFARQNGAEGAVLGAQPMPVKAQAVGPLGLDVVNDAVAASPHQKVNAAVYGPVHPCANPAYGFASWCA
jgi:hypothetical protein